MDQLPSVILTVLVGIASTALLYWLVFSLTRIFPLKIQSKLLPIVFIGPVFVLAATFMIVPAFQTGLFSFMDDTQTSFVGFDNYAEIFNSPDFLETLSNNALWILIVPFMSIVIGLALATFSNAVGPIRERIFKSVVFMPMAISFVSVSAIWKFAYSYRPVGNEQLGLLNALIQGFGEDPIPLMTTDTFKLNSLLMMVAVLWGGAGFATVMMSAAIKGVPEETVEAAKIDGAGAGVVFFKVILPQISGTVLSIFVTSLIGIMKIFDIIYAMTGGNNGTNVLGLMFVNDFFKYGRPGQACAIIIILLLFIIPVMFYQIRIYRKQEELR